MSFFYVFLYLLYLLFAIYAIFCTLNHFFQKYSLWEVLFFSLVIAALNTILLAMVLAIGSIYSFTLLMALQAGELLILYGIIARKKYFVPFQEFKEKIKASPPKRLPLLILVAAFILYMLFPTCFMVGIRDPGLYFLNGIRISQTGGLQIETDEFINENYAEYQDLISLGYPGIYSDYAYPEMDSEPGDLTPQFMPMFSAALAVGYDLGGISLLIRTNGLIGILSLLAIYYFTRRFFGQKTAVISILFMTLCPAQLWGARLTETEVLAQLLFFLGMYCCAAGWRGKASKMPGRRGMTSRIAHKKDPAAFAANAQYVLPRDSAMVFLGGILLGVGIFNRIDTYIFGIGIYFILVYCAIFNRQKLKYASYIAMGYTLLAVLAFAYGWAFSRPYFIDHMRNGSLSGAVMGNIAMLGVALVVCLVTQFMKGTRKNYFLRALCSKKGALTVALLFLGIFLCVYFLRPLLPDGEITIQYGYSAQRFANRAMVEFCWYTSFAAVLLAIYGIYHSLRKPRAWVDSLLLFFVVCISNLVLYIYNPSITPDHIWAARRWLPVCIPFILMLSAFGIQKIGRLFKNKPLFLKKHRVALQAICVCLISAYLLYQSWPFMFTRQLQGLDGQYEQVASTLDDDTLYFTDERSIASYLRFVYGKRVYIMQSKDVSQYTSYLENHPAMYYIGDGMTNNNSLPISIELLSPHTIQGEFLERGWGEYPRNNELLVIPANVFVITNQDT